MDGRLALGLVSLLLVGCVTAPSEQDPAVVRPEESGRNRPPVIALLDSGANGYLSVFKTSTPPDLSFLPEYTTISLAKEGNISQRLDQDADFYKSVVPGSIYHFEGTRLLSMTFADTYPRPTFDSQAHGAAVSQLAAQAAPDAIILMIQIDPSLCIPPTNCTIAANPATAMEWAASQPWIDVISSSFGPPGNPPDDPRLHAEMAQWLNATESAARSGKLVLTAAGNAAVPGVASYIAGPPWVIAVGGSEAAAGGDALEASKAIDIIANFTNTVESPGLRGETWTVYGTSFAAPIVAGTLAQAMHELRREGVAYDREALRDAMNASAILFSPTAWRPALPNESVLEGEIPPFSTPAATPAQTGWGHVEPALVDEIVRRVREGDFTVPDEKAANAAFQAEWQRSRERYWARYAG